MFDLNRWGFKGFITMSETNWAKLRAEVERLRALLSEAEGGRMIVVMQGRCYTDMTWPWAAAGDAAWEVARAAQYQHLMEMLGEDGDA